MQVAAYQDKKYIPPTVGGFNALDLDQAASALMCSVDDVRVYDFDGDIEDLEFTRIRGLSLVVDEDLKSAKEEEYKTPLPDAGLSDFSVAMSEPRIDDEQDLELWGILNTGSKNQLKNSPELGKLVDKIALLDTSNFRNHESYQFAKLNESGLIDFILLIRGKGGEFYKSISND